MSNLTFIPETHQYLVDGVEYPSVTQIIKSAGLSNFDNVPYELLDRAIQFGNAVHKAIELKCKGTLDENTVDDAIKGHILQWEKFCSDFCFISEAQEVQFSHKLGFAGTIDHIGKIGRHVVLVDIKTGQPKSADIVQVCAYGTDHYFDRLIVIYVSKDKYKAIEIKGHERRKGERIFLSALSLYNYKKSEGLL